MSTVALWGLAALVLSNTIPAESALAAPILFVVNLIRHIRQPVFEPVRAIGQEKRKVRRLNSETDSIYVRKHEHAQERTASKTRILVLNAILTLAVLDHAFSSRFISCRDVSYARTTGLTDSSARIAVRLPNQHTSSLTWRPLVPGTPWSTPVTTQLSHAQDWTAEIALDTLQPGVQYEYKFDGLEQAHNFTTFPDQRLQAPFRFVHTGEPAYHTQPYRPIRVHPHLMWSRWWHSAVTDRIRSPALDSFASWVEDMQTRTAWAPNAFALVGHQSTGLRSRQLMAASARLFETLPILPSRVQSPARHDPEPAALSSPEDRFSYGNVHFFRLHPAHSGPREDDQDWRVDVEELRKGLSRVNSTEWKFVISHTPLGPFVAAAHGETAWRETVLDVLEHVPNVVVLSESKGDFRASQLRGHVIEITSPALDGGAHQFADPLAGKEEPRYTLKSVNGSPVQEVSWEKVDKLLKQFKAGRANWSSVEVQDDKVYVVFVRDRQPVWKLEIVGEKKMSHAVGTVAQTLQNLLKRLGLSSTRWF